MPETLAPLIAPVIPLPRRVPAVPAFPSQEQVDVLAMVLAYMGYDEAFARSQPPEDDVLWLPVAARLKSRGMP